MSESPDQRRFAGLLTGRWQAPTVLLAVGAAAWALYALRPAPREIRFDAILADIYALRDGKAYYDAANATANLIEMQPALPSEQRSFLHNLLSELIYQQERLRLNPLPANAEKILANYDAAVRLGAVPTGADLLRCAAAREWLGESQEAIRAYANALEAADDDEQRRMALQALVRLVEGRSDFESERREWIEALLSDPGGAPGYQWSALLHALQEAFDRGDVARAKALATKHGERFRRSDLRGYYEYIWAWVNTEEGRFDEAEPQAAWVEEWLTSNNTIDETAASVPGLRLLNRWLWARIMLAQDRPQEALAKFDQALAQAPRGDLLALASIGRAESLARLERHEEAREALLGADRELRRNAAAWAANLPKLQRAAATLAMGRQDVRDFPSAVEYLDVCLTLTPPSERADRLRIFDALGRAAADAAIRCEDPAETTEFHSRSGVAFEAAAGLDVFDVTAHADRVWASAQEYDLAGQPRDARRMLLMFVRDQADEPRIPTAMLRIGQSYAADGLTDEALAWYRRLAAEFPRLQEAARASLLLGETLAALGEANWPRAEQTLLDLLASDTIAPDAQVYRDALFALADLYYRQERFGEAISRLEDFRELYRILYPEYAEHRQVGFALADCYRQSAYALRAPSGSAERDERAAEESRVRFRKAAALFEELLSGAKLSTDPSDELYQRLALFYRGDCLFELNEPDTAEDALITYQQAAARYATRPAGLAAQVQIANIYLRQGKLTEAARAIEKARWLLGGVPDQAFVEDSVGMDRAGWERYLASAASSDLLAEVFKSGR